jgi:DNA-binding NtrC family response regulator
MPLLVATTDEWEPPKPIKAGTPLLLRLYDSGVALEEPVNITLRGGTTVLGRAAEEPNGISIDDKRVSRVHATLQFGGQIDQLLITDAGSRNGTFVNGVRVTRTQLRDGDILRIGDTLFMVRFHYGEEFDAEPDALLGASMVAARLRHALSRVAPSSATVLFLGETGTGKEVAARYVHTQSGRGEPFVAVNCGALPETLAESQLFGHTRGAFTGAAAHSGFFRSAQNGTLLLDEIGELPLTIQPKLLRVLEERMIFPVGSVVGQPLGARLLFATNRNILGAVSSGKFRADLYSRIAEVVIDLPPLRMRREDIFLLLQHYLGNKPPLRLPVSLAEALLLHDWPFNVRELVKLASELAITQDLAAIESRLRRPPTNPTVRPPTESDGNAPPREELVELLRSHQGNVAAVARTLKCLRKYVYRWIEQYSLDLNEYRG